MPIVQAAARGVSSLLGRESAVVRALRPLYEATLAAACWRRGIEWPINGVSYRVDPRQRRRLGQEYEQPVADYLRGRLGAGMTCFDIGANVGAYVLQLACWTAPAGRIFAFEPNPDACRVLRRHILYNGLLGRVEIVPAAVSSENGTQTLYAAGPDGMSRLAAPNRGLDGRTVSREVPVLTVDGFCRSRNVRPDLLLFDIEGFEIQALRGAEACIRAAGPSLTVVVEMHPNVWDSAGSSREDAERLIASLGRRVVPLSGQRDPLADHGLVALEPL